MILLYICYVTGQLFGEQKGWSGQVACYSAVPGVRVSVPSVMRGLSITLLLICSIGGYADYVQASTATVYYVLDPDFGDADATVISLEDANTITAGNTLLILDSGEAGVIPAVDLPQGVKVSGTGAFTLGNSVNGTDLPNPESFAGTQFSIPHKDNGHQYLLFSPNGDAQVTIKKNGDVTHVTLAAGQVYSHDMGDDNGERELGIIASDVPIFVQHKGYNNNDARHSYPLIPAALEVWGFRSRKIIVGAAGERAEVDLYAGNGDTDNQSIDGRKWKEVSVGDNDSEGRGDAIHIVSDELISAIQFDDSDGRESTAFFSRDYLATHYALPVDSQYVAVLCVEENTVITLYEEGYSADEKTCNATGQRPGKVYFGSSSDGVRMESGARIEATRPIYLIYEDADTNDEKNLLGFNLWGPELSVVSPGEQSHLETRNVLLQIKAVSSEGDPLSYSAAGLPTGLVIDADTGLISGKIAPGSADIYSVLITADDGLSEASVTFDWIITGGNIGIELLFQSGDFWKFLDDGSHQYEEWQVSNFDDDLWVEGISQFGFDEGDEATIVNRNVTTYFRKEFVLADNRLVTDLALRLMRDDGAVLYLNGHEVLRSNMPNGTIGYNTRASERVNRTNGSNIYRNENTFLDYYIDPGWLVDGVNVLAVEVHTSGDANGDMSFDLEMSAGIDLIEDIIPPDGINLSLISFKTDYSGNTVITGKAGAAEAFARITITTSSGETISLIANADGSFKVTLATDTGENVSITLADRHENTGETINVTAVGKTAGSFDVSPQGAATYSIPLTLPPGIAGMQPSLSIAYSSQAGNGLLGVGWSLQGLSAVTRCGTTRAQDGFIDGVDFDANDRFCLDGQRLIVVSGSYAGDESEYRTEVDSFSKIVSYTESGTSGVASFKVWTKSGQILEYGNTADSRIEATNRSDGAVMIWAVNRIEDTVSNYITMIYTENTGTGEFYPLRIDYTGNVNAGVLPKSSVLFEYVNKSKTTAYLAGSSIESRKIVSRITTQVGSAIVRNYNLSYQTGKATDRKQLVSVQECSQSACLPTMEFIWQDMVDADLNSLVASGHGGAGFNTYTSWADVNGDGVADWVRSAADRTQVRLSNGDGTFGSKIESAHGQSNLYNLVTWADTNGDGLADWLRTDYAQTQVRLSNGDGTFGSLIVSAHGAANLYTYASWADINGDGRVDWVRTDYAQTQVRLSNGDGTFGPLIVSAHGTTNLHTYASWADVNGDGLADWLRTDYAQTQVRLSKGDGTFSPIIGSPHGIGGLHEYATWADINGDGLTDWVRAGSDRTRVRFSEGDGTFGPLKESLHGTIYQHTNVSWIDINADGRADWLRAGSDKALVRISNGDGSFGKIIELPHGYSGMAADVSWIDLNGDGLTDWVRADSAELQARLHAGIRPDLISQIKNGVGIDVNLTHTPLTDNSVYTKYTDAIYPVLDIQAPLYVISSSSTSDGLGGLSYVGYHYEGLKVDVSGRGMLGYAKTIVTDSQTGIVTETDYSQSFPHIGMALRNTTTLNSKILSRVENTLDAFITASASVFFPHVISSIESTYELPGGALNLVATSLSSNIYEPQGEGLWGNVSRVMVTRSSGGQNYVKDTSNSYLPADTVNWYLGRLDSASVEHSVDGGLTETHKSAFEYDSVTGLLTAEIVEPGHSELELRKQYIYDVFGRKSTTTHSDSGAAIHAIASRGSSSIYTPGGYADPARPYDARLVNTNALGHSETQWFDTRFGVAVSQTGPNGLSTYWDYDDFGRKIHEDRADGTSTDWKFSWCGGHCANGGTAVMVEASGSVPVTAYSDNLSRKVRVATTGLNGNSIYKDTQYNNLGQVMAVSRPYYVGNSKYWTNYFYDEIGRGKEEHAPDGGRMETSYSGLSTTVHRYDQAGTYDQSVMHINNVQGKLKEMIDEGMAHTFYDYDPIGNLIKVTDSAGNVITMAYDNGGRKISMNDPDMGAWFYQYDAMGQLREQNDAKLQVVNMSYDKLGRMTSRNEVEGVSTWVYDAAVNGVGKLASVVNGVNGHQQVFVYDALGRVEGHTSSIDTETFTMAYTYDSESRRELTTYPTGFQVRNVYADSGHLIEVRDAANDKSYWQIEEINAEGKVTESFLGNGLQTWMHYDNASGYIQEINTGTVFGNNVQQLAYQFDPLGNLKQRKNLNQDVHGQPMTEDFTYDSRNRLLSATLAGVGNRTYGYDALGNIRQKSDYGNDFTYGAGTAGPHAVTKIKNGGIEQATYTYDENGNMVSGGGRTITWNSFNKAAQITKGGTTIAFGYDADHNRIKQVNGEHTTYYLSPRIDVGTHYEKEINNGVIEHKHYIYAAGQSIAIYTTKSDGTEKTRYLHKDHLGSTDVITDESGNVVERMSFEAFGSRRNTDWSSATGVIAVIETHHGFTGHEHLDEVGIIHMNGRLYDPQLGRFLSPDVQVQYPENSQSFNRYSYVNNNPLSYTDPSGYGFFSKIWKGVKKAFKNKVFRIVLAVVLAVVTYGAASAWASGLAFNSSIAAAGAVTQASVVAASATASIVGGLVGGAASGFVAGGILTGSLKGALRGAAAGAISGGVAGAYGNTWNAQRIAANSLAGGASSEISGGRFSDGLKFSLITSMVRVGWENARRITNNLKLEACASGNSVCSRNEWYELRTDGVRGDNGVPGARSQLSRLGMLEEGAVHGYDKWPVVGKYSSRFVNWTSKVHDLGNSIHYNYDTGFFQPFQLQVAAEAFEIYSFVGMPVAATYTAVARLAEVPVYSYDQL